MSGRGTRGLLVAIVVVLGVVAALVVVGRLQPRPLVVLAGDSITDFSAGALAGSIDGTLGIGGNDVVVVANPGATVGEMEPAVVATAADSPRQVVINLGTNDAVRTATVAEGLAAIERIAAAFPGAACIHLVTLSESMVAFEDASGPGPRAAELNQGLIELAERNGYRLIRWDQLAAAGVARGQPLTQDSIHPNDEGRAELADAYRDAVDAC